MYVKLSSDKFVEMPSYKDMLRMLNKIGYGLAPENKDNQVARREAALAHQEFLKYLDDKTVPWLTLEEAEARTGIEAESLLNHALNGRLVIAEAGRYRLIHRDHLDAQVSCDFRPLVLN